MRRITPVRLIFCDLLTSRSAIIHQMRCVVGLLICMSACQAQHPEEQVIAVYKQMEKAVQTGDAKTFIALWRVNRLPKQRSSALNCIRGPERAGARFSSTGNLRRVVPLYSNRIVHAASRARHFGGQATDGLAGHEGQRIQCWRVRLARRREHRRQATFDKTGKAATHRAYVAYWLMLERANKMIFQSWAGLHPDPLIQVTGRFFEVRVPLRSLRIADPRQTKITLGDAAWPNSAIFTLEAQQYR